MTSDPSVVTPEQTCQAAAAIMVARDCGLVPVVRTLNDRVPLTVVTDRDLLLALCQRCVAADQLRIADLGGRQPITCSPDLPLAEAAARMRRNRVRRLLVVDEHQRLLGVLALADLARACVDDHSLSRAELAAVLEGLCR